MHTVHLVYELCLYYKAHFGVCKVVRSGLHVSVGQVVVVHTCWFDVAWMGWVQP
jgi:hypothetical protein